MQAVMRGSSRRFGPIVLTAAALALGGAVTARAHSTIDVTVELLEPGFSTTTFSDHGTGYVALPAAFGSYDLSGFAGGILYLGPSAAPENILFLNGTVTCKSSCDATNGSGGKTLTIEITETGMQVATSTVGLDYANSFSGLQDGHLGNIAYASNTNVAFGMGTTVTMTPPNFTGGSNVTSGNSHSGTVADPIITLPLHPDEAPFSVTDVITVNEATNKFTDITMSVQSTPPLLYPPLPEPTSLALLGAGLVGLGAIRTKRKS